MASDTITRPSYFAREGCTVSEQGDLFSIEFPGGEVTMTPHFLLVLLERAKRAYADWALYAAERSVVAWEPHAEHFVLAFPKDGQIVRYKGEPC